ncbi:MAG: hypothetical protein U0610_16410 [bacterium]
MGGTVTGDSTRARSALDLAWLGFVWVGLVALVPFHAWTWLTALSLVLQASEAPMLRGAGELVARHVLGSTLIATVVGQAALLPLTSSSSRRSSAARDVFVMKAAIVFGVLQTLSAALWSHGRIEAHWPRLSRAIDASYRQLAAEGHAGAGACTHHADASGPCPVRLVEALERDGCAGRAIDVTLDDRSTEPFSRTTLAWCVRGDELELSARRSQPSTDPRGQDHP